MKRYSGIFTTFFLLVSPFLYAQQTERVYLEGMADYLKGEYSDAAENLSKLILEQPANIEYLQLRADCYFQEGKFQEVLIDLQTADQLRPGCVDYETARVYARMGDSEKAVYFLRRHLQGINRRPESEIKLDKAFTALEGTKAWKDLWLSDWYNRNEIAEAEVRYKLKSGDAMDALSQLNELIGRSKNRAGWYYLRAQAYRQLQESRHAMDDLDRAISLNKRIPSYYVARAELLGKSAKWKKAAEDYSRAIKLDATQLLLYRERALACCLAGEPEKGKEDIILYTSLFDKDPEGFLVAGKIGYESGNYKEAVIQLDRAISLDQSKPVYFYERGISYLELLKYQEAIHDFAQALDLDPGYADAWYRKGMARLYKGDAEGACYDLKEAGKRGHKEAFNKAGEICP
jgi:tetratricopeptide (TPR) repeat protein